MWTNSSISIVYLLFLGAILFCIGIWGISINRDRPISIFIALQIIFLSIILNLLSFSVAHKDFDGQVFAIFTFVITVVEFVIGISILFIFYKGSQK